MPDRGTRDHHPFRWRRAYGFGAALLLLAGAVQAQEATDSSTGSPARLQATIAALGSAALLRLAIQSQTVSGRLAGRTGDSLSMAVDPDGRVQSIPIDALDTLWVPARRTHSAALAGAGFGLIFGGLVALSPGREDGGLNQALGAGIMTGGLLLGLILDSGGPSWKQVYP